MASYSPAGYVAAVPMRTNRTLLVEGRGDKAAISKLLIELGKRNLLNKEKPVIDTAEDIPNEPGGNRARVESLHGKIGGSDHFAALVDREFRDFDLAVPADLSPLHRVIPQNLFWTRGHSVENYLATLGFILEALERQFPEHLPDNYANHVAMAYPSIIRACAMVTLAAMAAFYTVERIRTINRIDLWTIDGAGCMAIDVGMLQSVLTIERHVNPADCAIFLNFCNYYAQRLTTCDLALSQWISHGHLADSHLWCAIAALLRHYGMPNDVATQVAWTDKKAQTRTLVDCWSRSCLDRVGEVPQALIQWLCG